ncbi:hypothetical protein AB0425_32700 [Actinosynnema sp. NPDC051121]
MTDVADPPATGQAPRSATGASIARRMRVTWRAMDEPVRGPRVPGTVAVSVVAVLLMTGVSLYVVGQGGNLWYSDALSHLTIARRVFDNLSPGFQQLGTVWLPMPHPVLMPFVANLWLWSTGWAAALLGIICFGASTAALYRTAARLGLGRAGRLVVLLVLWTDISALYAHTTALTEPVLLMSITACIAGMAHWATARRPMSGGELAVYAGVPAAASVLSRYEGWVLVASMAVFIVIVEWRRSHDVRPHVWRFVLLRRVLPAVAPPALAIGWWLAYNFAIYRDPLEFMFGPYSAYAQQNALAEHGALTTKGNLGVSLYVYNWAVLDVIGVVGVVIGALGFFLLLAREGLTTPALVLGVLFGTFVFEVAALYLGQTVVQHAHSLPKGLFNVRYGLQPLPFCALGAGFAVHHLRGMRLPGAARIVPLLVSAALVGQLAWWAADVPGRVPVIAEGRANQGIRADDAAAHLRVHYDGGGVLSDEQGAGNTVIPLVGIPNREWYNRAAGRFFDEALAAPAGHARWILVNVTAGTGEDGDDLVHREMLEHPERFASYRRVYADDTHAIFKRSW